MADSTYGVVLKITTRSESHGKGIDVAADGCPAGLPLAEAGIRVCLDRREPGQSKFTTARQEGDVVEILSGVFEGKTTGALIAPETRNTDQRFHDHGNIMDVYRPGHADYTFDCKYGFGDYHGGGYSSGRGTTGWVIAGTIACELLKSFGITVRTYVWSVGEIKINDQVFQLDEMWNNRLCMPDAGAAQRTQAHPEGMMTRRGFCEGVVECMIQGMPVGVGEPVFEKLDANLAKAILFIRAVKELGIGDDFEAARALGSSNNDGLVISREGKEDGKEDKKENSGGSGGRAEQEYKAVKSSNRSGGTLGGISDGGNTVIRAASKLTSSTTRSQHTVARTGQELDIEIRGRHDPIIVPKAVVMVEAMTVPTAIDLLLVSMTSRLDQIRGFFGHGQNCAFKG